MSEQQGGRRCQWVEGGECEEPAAKHVMHGYQYQGAGKEDQNGMPLHATMRHSDLCDAHTRRLQETAGGVYVLDDGQLCSDCE